MKSFYFFFDLGVALEMMRFGYVNEPLHLACKEGLREISEIGMCKLPTNTVDSERRNGS